MKYKSFFKLSTFVIFLLYLVLVFWAFNSEFVEFLLKGVVDSKNLHPIAAVYYGLGVLLAIMPVMAISLYFFLITRVPELPANVKNSILLYILATFFICVSIFMFSATLPWSIPTIF